MNVPSATAIVAPEARSVDEMLPSNDAPLSARYPGELYAMDDWVEGSTWWCQTGHRVHHQRRPQRSPCQADPAEVARG